MGFFFLPVDSPVVYKQAKRDKTKHCQMHITSKQQGGKDLFSSNIFLATVMLNVTSIVPIQLQKRRVNGWCSFGVR